MARVIQRRSELYSLPVAQTAAPEQVPESDLTAGDAKYDHEGHWVYACFDDDAILAARFGFGRGAIDLSDLGRTHKPDKSFVMLRVELLTRDGAALWLADGQRRADEVTITGDRIDAKLPGVFEIAGYPEMSWRFNSDDRELEIDAQLRVRRVTVLPDDLMQHNLVARQMSVCDIQAKVRQGKVSGDVWGMAFHEHCRVVLRQNPVPTFGWRLYAPMRLDDGSTLVAYYTEDTLRRPVVSACFGLYHDAYGLAHFLPLGRVLNVKMDLDRKPAGWDQHFEGEGLTIDLRGAVTPTPVQRAWGAPDTPQTRKANPNFPLLFNVTGTIKQAGQTRKVQGEGLAEHLAR